MTEDIAVLHKTYSVAKSRRPLFFINYVKQPSIHTYIPTQLLRGWQLCVVSVNETISWEKITFLFIISFRGSILLLLVLPFFLYLLPPSMVVLLWGDIWTCVLALGDFYGSSRSAHILPSFRFEPLEIEGGDDGGFCGPTQNWCKSSPLSWRTYGRVKPVLCTIFCKGMWRQYYYM